MPKKKQRNEDIIPGVSTEQLLRVEALPWAKGCDWELIKLWNDLFSNLSQELTLQGFSPQERDHLLEEPKKILAKHRAEVLLKWTKPYVEALVKAEQPEAKAQPEPQPEAPR